MEGTGQGVRGLECPTKGILDFSRELDRSPAGWGTACTVIPRPDGCDRDTSWGPIRSGAEMLGTC